MPTALTTLANLQTVLLSGQTGDTAENNLLSYLITEATAEILKWCHREDFGLVQYTRVLSGNNYPQLILPDIPVQGAQLSGTTSQGSAVITGLPTTGSPNATNLFLYQSVMGAGIPQGAIISDVSSAGSGQISISTNQSGTLVAAPATASGTVTLSFGVALWKDDNALGGSAFNAFALNTLFEEGVNYYLDWDKGYGTTCASGIIWNASTFFFRPWMYVAGLVAPYVGPPILNCKIQYLAGYTSVPLDVQHAAELEIARARAVRRFGAGVQSVSNDMSVSLANGGKIDAGLFMPETRTLLAPYVVTPIPSS